jgi:hypothetical protein
LEITTNSTFLNLSFQCHRLASVRTFLCPNKLPRALPHLCRPSQSVFRIVMLADSTPHIIGVSAVIPTACLAFYDVNPVEHNCQNRKAGKIPAF